MSRSRIGSRSGVGRHAGFDAHHEIIFRRAMIAAVARDRRGRAHDAGVETLELRLDRRIRASTARKLANLLDRIVEQHRRPGPGPVGARLQVVQRAGVERGDFGPDGAKACERAGDVGADDAGRLVDDNVRDRRRGSRRRRRSRPRAPTTADGPCRGSRRRKWTWTTLAPSSNARLASRAISSGVTGAG